MSEPLARGELFDLQQLAVPPRARNEAAIRALCHNAWLGDNVALTRVLGRFKMHVDTTDFSISTHLLLDGYWEMWTTEAMLQFVRPGATVVDAGANLGYFTLLMAALAGPQGHVHAFEPNPGLAALLARNVNVNGFGGTTTVHPLALADRGGTARLTVRPGELGSGYLDNDEAPGIEVPLCRFDSLGIVPDFIKIDVEGAEAALWRGLGGTLALRRPLTCLVEWVADRYDDPERFLDEVLRHGFALSELHYDDGIHPADRGEVLAAPGDRERMLVLSR